jgi:hypothetical protein
VKQPDADFEEYYAGIACLVAGTVSRRDLPDQALERWPARAAATATSSFRLVCRAVRGNSEVVFAMLSEFQQNYPDWLYVETYMPDLNDLVELYPRAPLVLVIQGYAYALVNNHAAAVAAYDQALRSGRLDSSGKAQVKAWRDAWWRPAAHELLPALFSASILLFVVMVTRKYRWTAPPYVVLALFFLAGANATVPAGIFNSLITQMTGLHFFSPDVDRRALAFFLGAGLGEEFFKLASGLLVVVILDLFKRDLGPAGRLLGFTVVGLSFATLEPGATTGITDDAAAGESAARHHGHDPWGRRQCQLPPRHTLAPFAALLVTTVIHGRDTGTFLLGWTRGWCWDR